MLHFRLSSLRYLSQCAKFPSVFNAAFLLTTQGEEDAISLGESRSEESDTSFSIALANMTPPQPLHRGQEGGGGEGEDKELDVVTS